MKKKPPVLPPSATILGVVRNVTFRDDETSFSVVKIDIDGLIDPIAVKGFTSATKGVPIICDGNWVHDPIHGKQFEASNISTTLPVTEAGIVRYLSGGLIKGIGVKTAQKIVAVFGVDTIKIIDETPDHLIQVPGFTQKAVDKIKDGWNTQTAVREITVFLQSYGISPQIVMKIHKTYGGKALKTIQDNPWKLARDVNGIGFKSADEIALKMGKSPACTERIQAALAHALHQESSGGHCGFSEDLLVRKTAGALELPFDMVYAAYRSEVLSADPSIISDNGTAWIKRLWFAEEMIALKIKEKVNETPWWASLDAEEEIKWVEFETNCTLDEHQKDAIRLQLKSKVMVLTGGPGCGKTFLLNSLLKILRANRVNCQLTAPTGKAAVKMKESTGIPATTMHRLLKLQRDTSKQELLDCDLLVIDESSMCDVALATSALKALPAHAGILFVGDADQLPSVGPGFVLGDLIASGAVPTVKLTKVFRQAAGSLIIKNAHAVNSGQSLIRGRSTDDFFFMVEKDANKIPAMIADLVLTRLPKAYGFDPVSDIQVLCPTRRSTTGTEAINTLLQATLNPNPVAFHEHFGTRFGVGDKVMQRVNNYDKDVFNGDSGVIDSMDTEAQTFTVRFATGEVVPYEFDEMDEIVLSSAMTIHKSQGSDFPAVIMPMTTQHYMMLQRNLLYTGITRARKLCIIIGQVPAVEMAIKNSQSTERTTMLMRRLMKD